MKPVSSLGEQTLTVGTECGNAGNQGTGVLLGVQLSIRIQVPHPQRSSRAVTPGGCCQEPRVGAEGHITDNATWSPQAPQVSSCVGVKERYLSIERHRQHLAIRALAHPRGRADVREQEAAIPEHGCQFRGGLRRVAAAGQSQQ
jgi:hypothetical protein